MVRSFVLGVITGGLTVWFWRDEIEAYLERKTRTARSRAAHGLQTVEETAERVLDRAAAPLRKAEQVLDGTKAKVGQTLRAGQDAIRPSGEPPEAERPD